MNSLSTDNITNILDTVLGNVDRIIIYSVLALITLLLITHLNLISKIGLGILNIAGWVSRLEKKYPR